MEDLGKLFGSITRVRLIKFFLMNEGELLDKESLRKKVKSSPAAIAKELRLLQNAQFIRSKSFFQTFELKTKTKKKRVQGFLLNEKCSYLVPLRALFCGETAIKNNDIAKKIGTAGAIKVIVSAGVFLQDPDSRIDLLIAGGNIDNTKLRNAITTIEAELGTELRYAVFETSDFSYRIGVCDRLIRDVLDYPHKVIVDKIGFSK